MPFQNGPTGVLWQHPTCPSGPRASGAAGLRSFVPPSDEELDFGTMKMVKGRVFYTGLPEQPDSDSAEAAPVVKQWFRHDAAAYLVECADYLSLKPAFDALEVRQASTRPVESAADLAFLAARRAVGLLGEATRRPGKSKTTFLAAVSVNEEPGVVLDYLLVSTALLTIQKARLFVVDDLGVAAVGAKQYRDLLEIIDDRCGHGSTLITSQYPVEQWHEVIGDATVADAILDRLVHNAYRLDLSGESIRKLKNSIPQKTS